MEVSLDNNVFGDKQIKVVRHAGDLKSAYLPEDGTTVNRQEKVAIEDMGLVVCAPYDGHFVYRHVYKKKGKVVRGWTLWCTCSSPAVVTGYDGYSKDASMGAPMLVCYHHATYNRHADGSS